jgi:hypothetical protein
LYLSVRPDLDQRNGAPARLNNPSITRDLLDNNSFTYPDSFFFVWLSRNKDHELYNQELNGRIFTIEEVLNLVTENKIPQNVQMDTAYGYKFEFYIEAQVWDWDILKLKRRTS